MDDELTETSSTSIAVLSFRSTVIETYRKRVGKQALLLMKSTEEGSETS